MEKSVNLKIWMRKVRVALTPRGCLLKTRLSNGALVFGKNRPGYGGRGIYIYRDALEPELEHFLEFLTPSGVLVDVGANTGIFTLKGAKYLSENGGTVIAIEPFPEMLATLQGNVQANGFTNVRLRNFCAGERTQTAVLWTNFDRPASFSLLRRDEKATGVSVLVITLDDLMAWEGIDRLDYLKIDVEGAESQILAGARKTIEKYRPIIQVEVNLADVKIDLANYSAFQPKADGSINRLLIPNESPKMAVPPKLGWVKVA